MKNLLVTGICLLVWCQLFTATVHAGNAQPLWSKTMNTNINWQKVTSLGQLVASTGKGLMGINTETGEEKWLIAQLKDAPENSYQQIEQSPFIMMASADNAKSFYIVDPVEGKIIFNSQEAGLEQVSDKFFLYQSNKIMVLGSGKSGKGTETVMVDMATGKKLWSKSGAYSFIIGAKDLGNNEVLVTSAFFASKLNAESGNEIWKSPLDPKTAGMASVMSMLEGFASQKVTKEDIMAQLITTPDHPDLFVIAAQKKNEATKTDSKGAKTVTINYTAVYMAFDIASGTHKWPAVVEMKFPLGVSFPAREGLVVCSGSDGNVNMLSYSDGSRMLGKKGGGLGLKGPGVGMAELQDGKLLVVSDNGGSSSLTVLDPKAGLLLFDKAAKIKGNATYTEMLPQGVLVGTDEEVNYLNTVTGEWHFPKAIEGGAGLIASNEKNVYIFNTADNLLYVMETAGNTLKPVITTPVQFQGKEKPKKLEVNTNGILLTSDQNLALINSDNAIGFNKYYPAPGVSDFRKALLIASAVRAAYYTAAFTAYSAAFGTTSQSIVVKDPASQATKDVTADISRVFGEGAVTGAGYTATYIKMATQRFKATTQAQDYMLIMTTETRKDSKLIQVSKADGNIMNTIPLGKDKQPVYDVDLVEGKLYYMKDGSKMECYKF